MTAESVPRDWWDELAEQTWPHGQQLTERQIDRIDTLAGSLDMNGLVEDFSDYWAQNFTTIAPSRLKTWVLSLRLRTWIRKSLERQPVSERQHGNRSDEYIEQYLETQRERGNQ